MFVFDDDDVGDKSVKCLICMVGFGGNVICFNKSDIDDWVMVCKKCDNVMLEVFFICFTMCFLSQPFILFLLFHICCYLFMHKEIDLHIPILFFWKELKLWLNT